MFHASTFLMKIALAILGLLDVCKFMIDFSSSSKTMMDAFMETALNLCVIFGTGHFDNIISA